MWLLFKCFQYTICYKNVISALELLFQSLVVWKRSSLVVESRRIKTTHQAVTRAYNSAAVLPRDRNMLGMMPMPRSYHHSQTQQPVWLQKAPNINLWQPATEISTPGGKPPRSYVDLPQMVPNTSNTG